MNSFITQPMKELHFLFSLFLILFAAISPAFADSNKASQVKLSSFQIQSSLSVVDICTQLKQVLDSKRYDLKTRADRFQSVHVQSFEFYSRQDGPGILKDIISEAEAFNLKVRWLTMTEMMSKKILTVGFQQKEFAQEEKIQESLDYIKQVIEEKIHSYQYAKRLQQNEVSSNYQYELLTLNIYAKNYDSYLAFVVEKLDGLNCHINRFLTPRFRYGPTELHSFVFELLVPVENLIDGLEESSVSTAVNIDFLETLLLRQLDPNQGALEGKEQISYFISPIQEPMSLPEWLLNEKILKKYGPFFNLQDLTLFQKAIELIGSKKMMASRKDKKTPYFHHLFDMFKILIEESSIFDPKVLLTAFLHDAIEDGLATFERIKKLFGEDVAILVNALTRKEADKTFSGEKKHLSKLAENKIEGVENLKLIRPHKYAEELDGVKVVRLVDRIQNLRGLNVGDEAFHAKVFFQTLDTFIPFFVEKTILLSKENSIAYDAFEKTKEILFVELLVQGINLGFLDLEGNLDFEKFSKFQQSKNYENYFRDSDKKYGIKDYRQVIEKHLKPYLSVVLSGYYMSSLLKDEKYYFIAKMLNPSDTEMSQIYEFFPDVLSQDIIFLKELYSGLSFDDNKHQVTMENVISFFKEKRERSLSKKYFNMYLWLLENGKQYEERILDFLKQGHEVEYQIQLAIPKLQGGEFHILKSA